MEPISLAVGIVPLAMNIVQMSSAIREKVSTYKSASSEIQAIIDKIVFIERICDRLDLEVMLASSKPRLHVDMLEHALQSCCKSISSVQKDVGNVTRSNSTRKKSLKYLISKVDIERSMYSLDDSINMLNTCINLSLLTSSALREEHSSSPVRSQNPAPVEESRAPVSIKEHQTRVRNIQSNVSRHENALYYYEVSQTTALDSTDENKRIRRRSYLFGLPLLGSYVSLAMRWDSLSPRHLMLDTPLFIYEEKDPALYEKIVFGSCDARLPGYTPRWSQWTRDLGVSGNTQLISRWGDRVSLLGLSVDTSNCGLFQRLLTQGGSALEDHAHLSSHSPAPRLRQIKILDRDPSQLYIKMRGPFLTLQEYQRILLIRQYEPAMLETYFDMCRELFLDDWQAFLMSTLARIIHFPERDGFLTPPLRRLGRKVIAGGFDLHQPWPNDPLGLIMTLQGRYKFEILELSRQWLSALENSSVDLEVYLLKQVQILAGHSNEPIKVPGWWSSSTSQRKLQFIYDSFNPSDRILDDEGSSDDLVRLLPAFKRPDLRNLWTDFRRRIPSHIDWKHERLSGDSRTQSWPFFENTSRVIEFFRFRQMSQNEATATASYDKFLVLAKSRFERKQERKWRRSKKAMNFQEEVQSMPGSWVMEWWEYRGPW